MGTETHHKAKTNCPAHIQILSVHPVTVFTKPREAVRETVRKVSLHLRIWPLQGPGMTPMADTKIHRYTFTIFYQILHAKIPQSLKAKKELEQIMCNICKKKGQYIYVYF